MDILKEPAILFFLLGILSVFLKTGLEIPNGLSKFLSLYLLMAIGFKGGLSLSKTGLSNDFFLNLIGGFLISFLIPVILYNVLKLKLTKANAAGVAATYGSVSVVTFIAGVTYLESMEKSYSGFMIAILALLEAPAIMITLYLYGKDSKSTMRKSKFELIHESLFNSSVFLLLGSIIIGLISGPFGKDSVGTLVFDLFKGLLCFFLMDLGIKSGKTLKEMKMPLWLILVAMITPLLSAALCFIWSFSWGLNSSDTFLLMCMGAGASYIAVPAALKLSLPEADSGLYLTMALGITFPFNILVGIPTYWWIINYFKASF